MNSPYLFTPEVVCNSGFAVAISSISAVGDDRVAVSARNRPSSHTPSSSLLIRMAMKISRSRWFSFLRRVFHYQNGSRSDLGSNPFNSGTWMMTEFVVLAVQITLIASTLAISKEEIPVWPLRIWVSGYAFGCLLSLMQLCWRYRILCASQGDNGSSRFDIEQQRNHEDSRTSQYMNKYRSFLDLFFAIWFVMGNLWVFDSRFGSFGHAPMLHILCISLLAWNAISYAFPFILFLLLCCCVPLLSNFLGYNMNKGSVDRGALDEQLSKLPSWRFKEAGELENLALNNENPECCICLAKYRDKEEIRQLPCSHIFHLKCVNQWLKIISCCPLCKKELER